MSEGRADPGAGRLALWTVLFPLLSLCAQWPIAWLRRLSGSGQDDLFPGTIFSDTIEGALAMRTVSHPLLTDPKVQRWPPIFQDWLFHNYYVGEHMTIYHVLPFGLLQLISEAKMIVIFSPWAALALPLFLYCSATLVIHKLTDSVDTQAFGLAASLFVASYPAIFMLHQANFGSGYANLGVAAYVLTALSGKWRWLGVLALACAINTRPNIALMAMIEFTLPGGAWRAFRRGAVIGAASAIIGLGSLVTAHMVDPKVSLGAFLHGYNLYRADIIFGDFGMYWNQSLFGVAKDVASMSGRRPAYDATTAHMIAVLSAVGLLGMAWLIWARLATAMEAAFMAASASVLMTPSFNEYHMLIMIAPLLVAHRGWREDGAGLRLERFWPVLAALVLACFALAEFPSGPGAMALFLLALCLPVVVAWRLGFPAGGPEPARGLIVVVSVLCLCALGGERTNALAVAGLLTSTVGLIGVACWRRRPGLTALARPGGPR